MRVCCLLTCLLLAPAVVVSAGEDLDVNLGDFDQSSYGDWKAAGEAFGTAPATSDDYLGRKGISGYQGTGAACSGANGEEAQGTLTSAEFTISLPYLNLLVGGSSIEGQACVNLLIGDQIVRTVTGIDQDRMLWHTWDVREFAGRRGRLQMVDRLSTGHIQVDQIALSHRPRITLYPNSSIDQAMHYYTLKDRESTEDSWRPRYHYSPVTGWMNDINGPFFHKGEYHLFYQASPYRDGAGRTIGWGHLRSRDLVHWERLPFAVWPDRDHGERACWSGGMAFDADHRPVLFYTSVPTPDLPDIFTQRAAVPVDDTFITWKKHPDNPVLPHHALGEPYFHKFWRDPCPFVADQRTFLCVGATRKGTPVYEARDGGLGKWTYRGSMFAEDAECPNFFPLDGRWVFITSAFEYGVKYVVGTFDSQTVQFTAQTRGAVDETKNFNGVYGTNVLFDDRGRCVFLSRLQGGHNGWNGCMVLPRVLRLDADGHLLQQPVAEVEQLRGERIAVSEQSVTNAARSIDEVRGDALEIHARLEAGDAKAFGLQLRRSDDGNRSVAIRCEGNQLEVAGRKFTLLGENAGQTLDLRIFLDRICLEIFINGGRQTFTQTITPPETDQRIGLFAEGGTARLVSLEAWTIQDAPVKIFTAQP